MLISLSFCTNIYGQKNNDLKISVQLTKNSDSIPVKLTKYNLIQLVSAFERAEFYRKDAADCDSLLTLQSEQISNLTVRLDNASSMFAKQTDVIQSFEAKEREHLAIQQRYADLYAKTYVQRNKARTWLKIAIVSLATTTTIFTLSYIK